MTHRIVVALNGDSYSRNTIVIDALVHSAGEIEIKTRDENAVRALQRLAYALLSEDERRATAWPWGRGAA